jgi:hypothetical protein
VRTLDRRAWQSQWMHSLVQVCSALSRVCVPTGIQCTVSGYQAYIRVVAIPARTATAQWRVPYSSMRSAAVLPPRIVAHNILCQRAPLWALGIELIDVESALIIHALRGNDIIWQFVYSHAYDVRYELKIYTPSLVNCNGPVSPEKSEQSVSRIPRVSSTAGCSWQVRDSGTGTMGTSSK